MNKYLAITAVCLPFVCTNTALAWDGFDADTTALVEITPAVIPAKGDNVDVKDSESETSVTCLVEQVTRNTRTVEISVITPDKLKRILIMELP